MKREDQALRLAQMMQSRVNVYPSYELALPLLKLERSKLKKLSVDNVMLLGLNDLSFILIENESICANLAFKMIDGSTYLEILSTGKEPVKSDDSKKYQILRFSFGKLQSRQLDVGYKIDITEKLLQDVSMIVEGNKYASGSLVNVDGELAVKIDKVEQ